MNLSATLRDASGRSVTNRAPEWASSKSSVAQVTGNGLVQAIGGGRAVISASADGLQGSAVVQVVLPIAGAPITNCRLFPADNIWNRDISRAAGAREERDLGAAQLAPARTSTSASLPTPTA